jgi:hypothetical protein
MQHEPTHFLLEITDHDRERLIDALDPKIDRGLVEELRSLEPWKGLVIEAPSVDAARMLSVVSSQGAVSFPVFCVFGPGARDREALTVKYDPDRVAYVARAIHRDMAIRSLINAFRQAADNLEARFDSEGEDVMTIVEAAAEVCDDALRALRVQLIDVPSHDCQPRLAPRLTLCE